MSEAMIDRMSVGSQGPSFRVGPLTRIDFVRYAGASGDFNPMHSDVVFAREHGAHDVFAQGHFTGGILARLVVDWFGLANLRTLRLRFSARVWPGDIILARGHIVSVVPVADGLLAECEIEAVRESNEVSEVVVFGSATALIPVKQSSLSNG